MPRTSSIPWAQRLAVTRAWLARRGWCDRPQPAGGERVALSFDLQTHLLLQARLQLSEEHEVTRFEDWRDVDGVSLPFLRIVAYPEDSERETWTAQHVSFPARPFPASVFAAPPPPDDVVMHDGAVEATVPLQIVRDKPRIPVRLNGAGPFTYVLDTGGHLIATPQTARAAGLRGRGRANELGAGSGILSTSFARVASVSIGRAVMRDQVAKIVPFPSGRLRHAGLPAATGWLGLETFERFTVRIDPRAERVTFTPRGRHVEPKGVRLPIVFDEDAPLIACHIDGRPGECMIDTGNAGETIVEGHWARAVGLATRLAVGKPDDDGFYTAHAIIAFGPFVEPHAPVISSAPAPRGSEATSTVSAIVAKPFCENFF